MAEAWAAWARGSSQQTYQVPWKLITPQEPVKEGLAVYWFPTGKTEVQKSSLRESRTLQLYSQQCVTMGIVDVQSALGQKYVPDGKLPVALLVQADGTVVNKIENQNGKLKVGDLEKLVESEMKKRESAVKEKMEAAKAKAKSGDSQAAIAELKQVVEQKCMFPGKAKDAVKELKKLGVTDLNAEAMPDGPNFDRGGEREDPENDVDGPDGGKRRQVHAGAEVLHGRAQP